MRRLLCVVSVLLAVSFGFAQPESFAPGQQVRVTTTLKVRQAAGLGGKSIGLQEPGSFGMILTDDPQFVDGYWWWRVEYVDGLIGWSAQGDDSEVYLVAIAESNDTTEASGGLPVGTSTPDAASAVVAGTMPATPEDKPGDEPTLLHASELTLRQSPHVFPPTNKARFDPTGNLIAMRDLSYSCEPDGKLIAIYDANSGKLVATHLIPEQRPDFGMTSKFDIAWSPDGSKLAYCSYTRPRYPHMGILDLQTGVATRLPAQRNQCEGDLEWFEDLGIAYIDYDDDSITASSLNLDSLRFTPTLLASLKGASAELLQEFAEKYPPRGILKLGNTSLRVVERVTRTWPHVPGRDFNDYLLSVSNDDSYIRPLKTPVEAIEVSPDGNRIISMGTYVSRETIMYEIEKGERATTRFRASFPDFVTPTADHWQVLQEALASGKSVLGNAYEPVLNPLTGSAVDFQWGNRAWNILAVVEIVGIEGSSLVVDVRFDNAAQLVGKVMANLVTMEGPSNSLSFGALWSKPTSDKPWAVLQPYGPE